MSRNNLYQGKEYFLLRIGEDADEVLIDEPVSWDNVNITLPRNADDYSFSFEFLEGEQDLCFAWEGGGGEEIEAAYDLDRGDALVILEFGILQSNTRIPLYLGRVNMNDRRKTDEGVYCGVERVSFEGKFNSRYDTAVSINAPKNLDNEDIDAVPVQTLMLHSKEIVKTSSAETDEVVSGILPGFSTGGAFTYPQVWVQLDSENIVTEELKDFFSYPPGYSQNSPVTDNRYLYEAKEAGVLDINLKVTCVFTKQPLSPFTWRFTPFVIKGSGSIETAYYRPEAAGNVDRPADASDSGQYPYACDLNWSLSVAVGDFIYIGLLREPTSAIPSGYPANQYFCYIQSLYSKTTFVQQTIAPRSQCKSVKVFDTMNYIVEAATGKTDRFVSTFFDTGGAGEKFALTNGYGIRNFDIANRPLQISPNDLITSLQAIFNLGKSYFTDGNGDDFFVMEQMSKYYGSGVALVLKDVYDYEEVHDTGITFNEFECGYEEYATDEFNSLDEFNTEATWLTPIVTFKNKLVKKSKVISSGYSIEIQRREQFATNPSTSMKNDDKCFIIAYVETLDYVGINYEFKHTALTNGEVYFNKPVNLYPGDIIVIAGVAGPYTIVERLEGSNLRYEITPNPATTIVGIGNLQILALDAPEDAVFSEMNQNFAVVDNVLNAANSYNLRITPKHILYNWSPLLNIGLDKKQDSEQITGTFVKNNGDVETQFSPYETNVGEIGYRKTKFKDPVLLSDFNRDEAPYLPELSKFKSVISWDDILFLKQALRGELTGGDAYKNYGRIVGPDESGVLWEFHIKTLKYNPVTNEAAIEANKVDRYWIAD